MLHFWCFLKNNFQWICCSDFIREPNSLCGNSPVLHLERKQLTQEVGNKIISNSPFKRYQRYRNLHNFKQTATYWTWLTLDQVVLQRCASQHYSSSGLDGIHGFGDIGRFIAQDVPLVTNHKVRTWSGAATGQNSSKQWDVKHFKNVITTLLHLDPPARSLSLSSIPHCWFSGLVTGCGTSRTPLS